MQHRCVSIFLDRKANAANPPPVGFALGSIEGRVAIHYVNPSNPKDNFTFKCHRSNGTTSSAQDIYAVVAFCCILMCEFTKIDDNTACVVTKPCRMLRFVILKLMPIWCLVTTVCMVYYGLLNNAYGFSLLFVVTLNSFVVKRCDFYNC